MESTGDKFRAIGYSLLLHGTIVLLMLGGLWWTRETRPVVMPGPIIEATLVGPTAAPKPSSKRPARPTPPKPEPPAPTPPKPAEPTPPTPKPEPEQAPPPAPPKMDTVDQQKVAALAQEKADQAKKEQEAKIKQRQIELEQEQKAEAERAKQLADIKKQREAAAKKVALEKAKLEQMRDLQSAQQQKADREHQDALVAQEAEQATTGAAGEDDSLAARYAAAIQAQAVSQWRRPEGIASVVCDIRIVQIPGGDVISASVTPNCTADELTRSSMEAAVRQQALPYRGYESVFRREVILTFCYPRSECPD
jgi:colicin import membrane protein